MEQTFVAGWLNSTFSGFDTIILSFMHTIAEACGNVLTPVMRIITLSGEKGILMLVIALVLMCFAKKRRAGVCMFGAVCCGALITNIILKDMVARLRPFEYAELFNSFWKAIGSPAEDGFSFPSGHATATMAGVTALCFTEGRKYIIPGYIYVVIMCVSRMYLMAHFPSDVLIGALVGALSAVIAYYISLAMWSFFEKHSEKSGLCRFVLDWNLFGRKD